jgi:hypothetical protein
MLPLKSKVFRGQALLEVLISLAIFLILAHALFTLVTTTYSVNTFNKSRIAARHLAQEKIETIRNMPYADIGTLGGIPAGNLQQNEAVSVNGLNYNINTTIVYIDDPFDGIVPEDILPTDYKRVSVEISWEGLESSKKSPLKMITDVSPNGIESTVSGGILSIYVFDANAKPVPQADVTIVSSGTTPLINMTIKTADNGRVILPGAPTCKKACYSISVSKPDYSSERTYSTTEVDNPAKPYFSVLQGQISEASFSIDKTGSLNIHSYKDRDSNFETLPNTAFTIHGEKIVGTDSDDNPIYKYLDNFTTDSLGTKILNNMEWDNYTVSISPTVGDISGLNPPPAIPLLPNTTLDVGFTVSNDSTNSVLLSFVNPSGVQIASVSARLYDNNGFESIATSGAQENPDFGQTFFSNLARQIYQLEVTISGFMKYTGTVDSYGYKQQKVILNPI